MGWYTALHVHVGGGETTEQDGRCPWGHFLGPAGTGEELTAVSRMLAWTWRAPVYLAPLPTTPTSNGVAGLCVRPLFELTCLVSPETFLFCHLTAFYQLG